LTATGIFPRHDFPLDSLNLYTQALWYWQDDTMYATDNKPLAEVDTYGLLDLALDIESNDRRYSA
jgi:hypothetical protein